MTAFQSNRRTRKRGVPKWLRQTIMRRAGGQCEKRGPNCAGKATQVDHIIPVAEGGEDTVANCEATCDPCHDPKTQEEAARGRARVARKRQPDRPVGSLSGRSPGRR
ncbi:HNH endonuclease signature motif containing protein [Corynebacterium sp.]|uniref:HNH endonuclease n=1 Tax=Corynebacterium sp. TaxID=1720 RepID=UPI0028A7BA09|nr:HNH endonuclease signature motif containing protein [Corynebacterium sp.]